jgi:hypothetical protein
MCWLDTIKEATGIRLEVLKEAVQNKKKNGISWWKKRLGIRNTQMRNELRRWQWQITPEQLIVRP